MKEISLDTRIETRYLYQMESNPRMINISKSEETLTIRYKMSMIFAWIFKGFYNKWEEEAQRRQTMKRIEFIWCCIIKEGKLSEIFESLGDVGVSLDEVCFTLKQIIDYIWENQVELNRVLSRDDYGWEILFLCKKNDAILSQDDPNNENLFFIHVLANCGYKGAFNIVEAPFSDGYVWCVENTDVRGCVMIPKIV